MDRRNNRRRHRGRRSTVRRNFRRAQEFRENICFCMIPNASVITRLSCCRQRAHQICLDTWLQNANTCPYCRTVLIPEESISQYDLFEIPEPITFRASLPNLVWPTSFSPSFTSPQPNETVTTSSQNTLPNLVWPTSFSPSLASSRPNETTQTLNVAYPNFQFVLSEHSYSDTSHRFQFDFNITVRDFPLINSDAYDEDT